MAEAGGVEGADPEVLDEDVGAGGQLPDDGRPLGGLEVDGEAALSAVGGGEVVPEPAVEVRGPGPAVVAGAHPLDLDDLGALVGEDHCAVGRGHGHAHLDHLQPRERSGHGLIVP